MVAGQETQRHTEGHTETQRDTQRQRMDFTQIFIFGLFVLAPVWTCKMHRCYEEHELSEAAERKLRSHYPQPAEPAAVAPGSPASCPVAQFQQQPSPDKSARSLSPWRYVLEPMKDHFPSSYAKAECLCYGCVLIQGRGPPVESHAYSSSPIKQSRVFLKRELCEDGRRYSLKPVTVEVSVGCTCVRANTS